MTLTESPLVEEKRALLQRRVLEEIERRGVTREQLAERLDLLPIGAEVLLAREDWSFETALRVAEVIGLEITFSVETSA